MREYSSEEWKDIPGYDGIYQASSLGRIKSVNYQKEINRNGKIVLYNYKEIIFKPIFDDRIGYLRTRLIKNGKRNKESVHALVCKTFHGPRPKGKVCRHLDGNSLNNCKENLQWSTQKENIHDKYAHGTMGLGEKNATSKLTTKQVLEIRSKYLRTGWNTSNVQELVAEYGVKQTTILSIINRRTWKHI